ncbi:MAG TPA: hypothetical protein VNR17_10085 [Luteimicrobium sp.]|nr:hypothetical protein [Luteimicrobium sp.]
MIADADRAATGDVIARDEVLVADLLAATLAAEWDEADRALTVLVGDLCRSLWYLADVVAVLDRDAALDLLGSAAADRVDVDEWDFAPVIERLFEALVAQAD